MDAGREVISAVHQESVSKHAGRLRKNTKRWKMILSSKRKKNAGDFKTVRYKTGLKWNIKKNVAV